MFNIMVTASDNAWEEGAYTWDRTRILEYTEEPIRGRLHTLSNTALEELASLPTLFMYEQDTQGTPRVGRIKRIQQRGSEFRVIFEFDETVPPLTREKIVSLKRQLQLANFEFSRTHWAVKEGDLYAILKEDGHIRVAMPIHLPEPITPPTPAVDVTPAKVFWFMAGTKQSSMRWRAFSNAVSVSMS
ncbi:hypothetical protein [Acidocella sp. KAb 2-4]|uniref:hypothetical protein n=1 Tax=Acidocella sp. KAb 2-4 TaxID=2885158 RepID=UPI001D061BFE|nr:hypothetical protein [Acidocella sp. KAb 2-4]MCB5943936.1 hypothetical protein [Acidocella sp. KAb 2-4]